jgi:hypothetical protein
MAQLTHEQYDDLDRAVRDGSRLAVWRRGTEYIVIPSRLRMLDGREAVEAIHPTTGESITIYLDDVDSIELVR